MTHEITGAGIWRATITSPVAGEDVNQAAWDTPNQDIADSLVYLKNSNCLYIATGGTVGVSFSTLSSSSYTQIGSVYVDVPAVIGNKISFLFYVIAKSSATQTFYLKGSYSGAASGDIPGSEIEADYMYETSLAVYRPIPYFIKGAFTASATGTYTLIGEHKITAGSGNTDFYGQYYMKATVT